MASGPNNACLSWDVVQAKLPWGILLLIGAGFAMAEAADKSKLSVIIGEQLRSLDMWPKELIVFVVSLLTSLITEAATNSAVAAILLPVLKELVSTAKIDSL